MSRLVLLTKCYLGDQITEDKMGMACGMSGRTETHIGFWQGNLKERDHFKDLGIGGRVLLKWTLKH
jgi:hypothetical protein